MLKRVLMVLAILFMSSNAASAKTVEPIISKKIVHKSDGTINSSNPLFFVDAFANERGQPKIHEYPSMRNLLYPNANTSFFSVNIDSWIYHNKADLTGFSLLDSFRWETYTHGWCRFWSDYENIEVREDITIIREKVHIRLTFTNYDYYSHYIEARYLLDPMIDANDGAYLWQENLGLQGNEREVY